MGSTPTASTHLMVGRTCGYSRGMRPTILVLLFAFLLPSFTGCAWLATALPKVINAIVEAELLVDAVEDHVELAFLAVPNPEAEKTFKNVVARVRFELQRMHRAGELAQSNELRVLWAELMKLAEPYGVRVAPPGDNRLGAPAPGVLVVPVPMALSLGDS